MGVIEVLKKQERQQGIKQGIKEERAKAEAEKRAIALEFKKMGLPLADIAKGTGFTIEELERL